MKSLSRAYLLRLCLSKQHNYFTPRTFPIIAIIGGNVVRVRNGESSPRASWSINIEVVHLNDINTAILFIFRERYPALGHFSF